jgi:Ca2+-dependent lipid-binding protein
MSPSRFLAGFLTGAVTSFTLAYLLSAKRTSGATNDVENGETSRSHDDDYREASGTAKDRPIHLQQKSLTVGNSFVSNLIHELWGNIDVYLSSMIRETVEPMMAQTLPSPLSSLKFTKLSLGQDPIRLENFTVVQEDSHPRGASTGPTVVKVYIDVTWQARCDIQLEGSMGMAMGVNLISFHGRLVCLLFPMNSLPIVSAVNASFLNVPDIHLGFTGLASVAEVKMIKRKVTQGIQKSMEAMMVLPTSMLFRIDSSASFVDLHSPPRGILRVTLLSGQGFQAEKRIIFGQVDVADIYCVLSMGDKVWTSSTVDNSLTPTWNESVDFLFHDVEQVLTIHAWDRDQGTLDYDDHLGVANLTVREALSACNGSLCVELMTSSSMLEKTGIVLKMLFEPLALIPDCSSLRNSLWVRDHLVGVLEILVLAAHDLSIAKASASTFVKVRVGTHEFVTGTVADAPGIDALNPQYDCGFVVPIQFANDLENDVLFTLYSSQTPLGSHSVPIQSLLEKPDRCFGCQQSFSGHKGSNRVDFCVWIRGTESVHGQPAGSRQYTTTRASPKLLISELKPRSAATSTIAGATQDSPSPSNRSSTIPASIVTQRQPLGTVRVTVVKGFGFRPHRRIFRRPDVPDVYCQVDVHDASLKDQNAVGAGQPRWRTKTARDSVNPVWSESHNFPFYDESDVIVISVYDEDRQRSHDHDLIGSGRIAIATAAAISSRSSSTPPSRSPSKPVPIDVAITRSGKGNVAFVSILVEKDQCS